MADRRAERRSPAHLLALGVVVGALILVAVIPVGALVREIARGGWAGIADALGDEALRTAARNTLWTSGAVTVLVVATALAAALVVERAPRRTRTWLRLGLLTPLVVPPFVSALSWVAAYGERGILDDAIGVGASWIVGPAGVVAVIAVNGFPLAYLVIAAALASRADLDLERAARVSGAGRLTVLRTVTVPLLARPLGAAAALVFVFAANSFGVPAVLGSPAGFATVTTRIYEDLAFSASPEAFQRLLTLAAGLVLLAFVVVGFGDRMVERRPPGFRVEPAAAGDRDRPRSLAVVAVMAGILATVVGPLVALLLTALTPAPGVSPVPGNWTLANFREALDAGAGAGLVRSILLSAGAALVVLALGAVLVAIERRHQRSMLGTATTLTFAIPGSALAVAVLLAYGARLRDTLTILLIAYLAKFWSLGHRPLSVAVGAVGPDPSRAARISGAGPLTALRTVIVPMVRPAALAAWLLVFLFAVHELTISSLLYGPGNETLAVAILNLRQIGEVTVTAAMGVGLTVVAAAIAVPLLALWRTWSTVEGR